jgi:hypothetical protein
MRIISLYFARVTGNSARDKLAADCKHSQNKALYKQGITKKAAKCGFFHSGARQSGVSKNRYKLPTLRADEGAG